MPVLPTVAPTLSLFNRRHLGGGQGCPFGSMQGLAPAGAALDAQQQEVAVVAEPVAQQAAAVAAAEPVAQQPAVVVGAVASVAQRQAAVVPDVQQEVAAAQDARHQEEVPAVRSELRQPEPSGESAKTAAVRLWCRATSSLALAPA
jgi:hypothetical protein